MSLEYSYVRNNVDLMQTKFLLDTAVLAVGPERVKHGVIPNTTSMFPESSLDYEV